jgi:hypothetical protein
MTVQQIIDQIRTYSARWRAQGITQIPIEWLNYWADQLQQAQAYGYPAVTPPVYSPYAPFFVTDFFSAFPFHQSGNVFITTQSSMNSPMK